MRSSDSIGRTDNLSTVSGSVEYRVLLPPELVDCDIGDRRPLFGSPVGVSSLKDPLDCWWWVAADDSDPVRFSLLMLSVMSSIEVSTLRASGRMR